MLRLVENTGNAIEVLLLVKALVLVLKDWFRSCDFNGRVAVVEGKLQICAVQTR